jgi:hypothetical protein
MAAVRCKRFVELSLGLECLDGSTTRALQLADLSGNTGRRSAAVLANVRNGKLAGL